MTTVNNFCYTIVVKKLKFILKKNLKKNVKLNSHQLDSLLKAIKYE